MSEATIQALGTVVAAGVAGFAAYKSSKAEKNSRPVSNGFASGVREDLRELRALLIRHIENHDSTKTHADE